MKITLDTNVLISSSFWHGDSDRILSRVENKEIELVLSKEIIEEFIKVLNYKEILDKIREKNLKMKRTIEKIISLSVLVEPSEKFGVIQEDPDDNIILECASEGKVDFIVSQDMHLLKLGEFQNIKIVSPEEFLRILG
ncbi:MAG: putative toxin-antitoxin system toxin component, PIN family [Nanoarchaeota archaeon]